MFVHNHQSIVKRKKEKRKKIVTENPEYSGSEKKIIEKIFQLNLDQKKKKSIEYGEKENEKPQPNTTQPDNINVRRKRKKLSKNQLSIRSDDDKFGVCRYWCLWVLKNDNYTFIYCVWIAFCCVKKMERKTGYDLFPFSLSLSLSVSIPCFYKNIDHHQHWSNITLFSSFFSIIYFFVCLFVQFLFKKSLFTYIVFFCLFECRIKKRKEKLFSPAIRIVFRCIFDQLFVCFFG